MASYLGKISAVVVANTTGFQRNLNSAASDLRNFAGVVQRDITRASSEANKAFSSMLTPLQRLERSLQAASSMKLSFRGFAGAIRTVDELRDRLTRLQGSQVDLVVKASGLRTISQFRQALEGIQQKDFDFAVRFGGTAGLREIRRQIDTLSQESVNATLFAGRQPGVTNVRARLESLRETVDSLSGRSLQLALQVGGEQKLRRAEQQAIGLSKRDLQLFLRVGGREGLDRVIEEIQTVDKTTIDALVSVRGVAELDAVLEKIDQLSPEQITTVLNVLGEQDLVSATQKVRALASASRQVIEPLAAVASQLPALGLDVEMAFTPGLRRAQRAADELSQEIESIGSGASSGRLESLFKEAAAAADRTTQAFARLRQASSAVAAFDDGTSFRFVQPEAAAAVEQAISAQRQTLGLSPEQFRRGGFAQRSGEIAAEIRELERLNAVRESVFLSPPGFGESDSFRPSLEAADAAIVSQVEKVNNLLKAYERVTDEITAADRARAASSELNILSTDELQESRRSIARQASDQLPVLSDRELRDSISSELGLGPDIEDSRRQFSVLGQQVAGLKGQLDQLPLPVRAQFVPAIKQAEDNLIRLRGAADASQEEIQQAADALRQLERSVNFAGRIEQFNRQFGDFGQFLQGSRVNQFAGELQALQQILGRVGVEAGSDAAQAFQRLQRAMAAALDPKNLNSKAAIAELKAARTAAIIEAARAGGGSPAGIRRQLRRAGDVSRFGADKASLALQQAAFAVDDFFSATGDISQKIRAVQNNVTQLAFILGGTTGLFIGLGVAIAAQATVALVKWTQGGVDAADKTKALNDSLARQKSIVEELKKAFDSLGDSLTRGIFSDQVERSRDLSEQIDEIRQRSQELRREQVASLDLRVNQERGLQASLRARLESETDAGTRIGLERRIELSRQRESDFAEQAQNRNFLPEDVAASVIEGLRRQFSAREGDLRVDAGPQAGASIFPGAQSDVFSNIRDEVQQERQRQEERLAEQIAQAGGDPLELAAVLERRRDELAARADELDSSFSTTARERSAVSDQLRELQQSLQGLQAPIREAILELSLSILEGTDEIGASLRNSRNAIENTIGGFGPLASIQSKLAARFDTIVQELAAGRAAGDDGRVRDDGRELTQEEVQQRNAVLERLQQEALQLESTTRSAEALEQAFRRLADQLAETVRQEAAADVERTRRAANAAEARGGNGIDDLRLAAERELAQGPQVEPLIDLEPLRARVQADQEAATAVADRVAADLRAIVDADEQRRDEEFRIVEETASRLSGGDLRRFARDELAETLGSDGKVDASLAARGQLQSRSVEEVRQAFVAAGADASTIDDVIADRLKFQEDEQKYWARVGGSYTEETRKLKAAEAALDSAFSTDEEQQRFVAAYNELTAKVDQGVDGASKQLSEITKQFTDRLSDEQLAELTALQDSSTMGRPGPVEWASKQDIESRGGRLKAAMDEFGFETVEGFRSAFSSQELNLEGLNEAIRKQITDSLDPGQLTPANIQAIADNYSIERSRENMAARDTLGEINDFRRGGRLDGTGIPALDQLGSRLSDSARELSSAEFSNERNQELASEIESIRNAIDAFDGSLESRRAIVEAADASRFDEIADAADIFLQKVRDLDLERAVTAFEEQIALEGQQRIEQLDQRRQEFQRDAQERFQRDALRGNDPAGIADLIRQRDQLLSIDNRTAEQESRLAQAGEAIRNAFEQTAEGQQAARLADEIDIERQRQVQARAQRDAVRESAARGQDLLLRPEDLAARRGFTQFEDAQNAVLENLIGPLKEVGGDGVAAEIEDGILSLQELSQIFKRSPEIRQQLEGEIQESLANLQQARDNITGNVAAQIAQFDLERSRPSRQALQAQDINTQQGRAELNRLLRGDDANRDQPILQGIKEQTAILKLIDGRIDEVKRAVGVAGA